LALLTHVGSLLLRADPSHDRTDAILRDICSSDSRVELLVIADRTPCSALKTVAPCSMVSHMWAPEGPIVETFVLIWITAKLCRQGRERPGSASRRCYCQRSGCS